MITSPQRHNAGNMVVTHGNKTPTACPAASLVEAHLVKEASTICLVINGIIWITQATQDLWNAFSRFDQHSCLWSCMQTCCHLMQSWLALS